MPIEWSATPPTDESNYGYRLIRCPAFKALRAIILNSTLLGTRTHYHKARTLPCDGLNCTRCQEGLPWRWHAYLAVLAGENRERCILELTAQSAEQLKPTLAEFGTLRGTEIMIQRPSQKPNGRVRLLARRNGVPHEAWPDEPDVGKIMLHIWGLDDKPMKSNGQEKHWPAEKPGQPEPETRPITDSANP